MGCDGLRPDPIGTMVGRSGKTVRAWLRRRWPEQAPGQGGEWFLDHRQVQETIAHFHGVASERLSEHGWVPRGEGEGARRPARRDSDQAYVVDIVARIIGEPALGEHTFDWLRGDAGTKLRVDAYFPAHGVVVEYRERQHLAERDDGFRLWDNRPTVSGMSRREQRKRYDLLREQEIPGHGLRLLIVTSDDLAHDSRGRLLRNVESDGAKLRSMLEPDD